MTPLARWTSAGMAPLLLYAAAVQYNDPDPLRWVAIYVTCALVAALAAIRGRVSWYVPAIPAVFALGWSIWLATRVVGQQPLFEEEGREMIGLLIGGGWMAILAASGLSGQRRKT